LTGKTKLLLDASRVASSVLKLAGSLLLTWLTLGWHVRRARKAFEAELRKGGIPKEDARRLSRPYSDLRDQFSLRSMISYIRERGKRENP